MADEEEVGIEVEAVYGEDCVVIKCFPTHLHVHIKPRTADDPSQQFVEVVLDFRANPQYLDESPHISIIESKALDEIRQLSLVTDIKETANELSSCLMLVALCESPNETEADDDTELLQSAAEKLRRLNFEALLKLQEDHKGLIQPKRNEVLHPGYQNLSLHQL